MSGPAGKTSFPRLTRWALVLGCGLVSTALLGATPPKAMHHAKRHAKAHFVLKTEKKSVRADAPSASLELLHDAPAVSADRANDAALASARIPGLRPHAHTKTMWMLVTAYCGCKICCGPHARGLTASGRSIAYNGGEFVAADAKLFKFGSKLRIPGYANDQPVEVIDRGGAIKGYHLDVFFPSHQQAREWGKRWIAVTVVE